MTNTAKRLSTISLACIVIWVSSAAAMDSSNVLVLYNAASEDGLAIATHYAEVHPGVQLLGIEGVPTTEQVSYDVYLNQIRPAVLAELDADIDCIVTTKGMPLRIDNPRLSTDPAKWNRYSSLESELTRIDTISTRTAMGHQDWLLPTSFGGNDLCRNPYFDQSAAFSYSAYGIRLTSRLDGFNAADVNAAVDAAQRAVLNRPGYSFVLDDDPDAPAANSDRMPQLNDLLAGKPETTLFDTTNAFLGDAPGPVLGYVSHGRYSGAPAGYVLNEVAGLKFDIAPGAIFQTYESFNAYSFNEDGNRNNQGLVAEWIARGGTAGFGHVEEPYAAGVNIADESIAFEMMLEGSTWAEAAWSSLFQLSYVNTVVGDPLMTYSIWEPGDFDLDGDVDMWDVRGVQAAYNSVYGDANYNVLADMNSDGAVDLWDLLYTQSCYTGTAPPPEIPEPLTALLLLAGAAPLLRKRRYSVLRQLVSPVTH